MESDKEADANGSLRAYALRLKSVLIKSKQQCTDDEPMKEDVELFEKVKYNRNFSMIQLTRTRTREPGMSLFPGCIISGCVAQHVQHGIIRIDVETYVDWDGQNITNHSVSSKYMRMSAHCMERTASNLKIGSRVYAVVVDLKYAERRIMLSFDLADCACKIKGIELGQPLPDEYKEIQDAPFCSYLQTEDAWRNPQNLTTLRKMWIKKEHKSLLPELCNFVYEKDERYKALRSKQDYALAMESVKSGVVHQKAGRPEDAFRCYDRALRVDPKNADALVCRGALFTTKGVYDTAISDLTKALSYAPEHKNARMYLETTYIRRAEKKELRNKLEARKDYNEALRLNGDSQAKDRILRIDRELEQQEAAKRSMLAAAMATFGGRPPPPLSSGGVQAHPYSTIVREEKKSKKKEKRKKKDKKRKDARSSEKKKKHKRRRTRSNSSDDSYSD
eukprot:m.17057 g.17057  ORF g.17057 m.17057 type:complete len:448 (-) comp5889_c0_seq1:74-1417(-)